MRLVRSPSAAAQGLSGHYRTLAVALALAPMVLVVAGVLLLVASGAKAVGVALLALGLLIAATPFGLVLRAFAPPPETTDAPPPGDDPPHDSGSDGDV